MGAFAYSEEEGTHSAEAYEDEIPDEVKQVRLSKLMRLQQRISAEVQEQKVGKTLRVIIDRCEGEFFIGRTEFDSPEVDPEVLIAVKDAEGMELGHFYDIDITSADDFDLYGTPSKEQQGI
jgi:ribosomal protein S12 methylthiotransferase